MKSIDELLKSSGLVIRPQENSRDDIRRLFLHAGEVWAGREPTEVTTILGSCVAICIWDPLSAVGGMNHFMLPHDIGSQFNTPRYASYATTLLLEELSKAGATRSRLQAKIFGGARVLAAKGDGHRDLGAQNVAAARDRLLIERIPIVDQQTGGCHGRKVIYQSATGDTVVTRVSSVVS